MTLIREAAEIDAAPSRQQVVRGSVDLPVGRPEGVVTPSQRLQLRPFLVAENEPVERELTSAARVRRLDPLVRRRRQEQPQVTFGQNALAAAQEREAVHPRQGSGLRLALEKGAEIEERFVVAEEEDVAGPLNPRHRPPRRAGMPVARRT